MVPEELDIEKISAMFPHLENVIKFGMYSRNLITNESHWTKGMYRILGLEEKSLEPSLASFSRYVVPQDLEAIREMVNRSSDKTPHHKIEFSIINAKGIYKRIYAETFFKRSINGAVIEYYGLIKDITENYEYKKALEEKVSELDKSNENLQEFVYMASHDLQEPLRKISTFAERLNARFGGQLGDEGGMYLKRMLKASLNMQTLLEDLLSFSKLSFHETPYERVSLKECLKNAMSDLEMKIEETSTQINCSDLPIVECYATQIKQLFNNLISNAIKFRKPGRQPLINISFERVNPYLYPQQYNLLKNTHYVKLQISDNGIGFEQEYAEKIFHIFQRLNSRNEYSGSGIGLSICKKITENHQGYIYATSVPNQGSVFTVLLPYAIS